MAEYGLIGAKLGHSFSKEIHSMIGEYDYELIELTGEELGEFLKEKNFKAVNITIPYKQEVIPFLDEITEAARSIGAVNCIRNDKGRLIGHNTDFDGLMSLIGHAKITVEGKKVLILGTGGTSDTAYAVCKALKAENITKVSRKSGRGAVTYDEAYENYADTELIINTTPCGMYPEIFEEPLDIGSFAELEGVVDVVYNPLRTKLVSEAMSKGIKAEGGLYMLVSQGVAAAEFFMDTRYEESLADEIYSKLYHRKKNIVLTGMPASGKTTIGRLLAEKLKREFCDTDALIVQRQNMTIPEIFEKYGEKGFREFEAEVIREVSMKSGAVIATGGGVVLRKENTDSLKMNGEIFFVDRDPELLVPTRNRPTAFDREQIMDRYRERYGIYISTADHVIKSNDAAQDAADKILEVLK